MAIDVLLGLQWGDEGKGKIVDYLAEQYDIVCRFQGGPNAGHTLYLNGKSFVLHTVPSGIFHDRIINVIGNGVVIDPITLQKELKAISDLGFGLQDKLLVSQKSHLILPTHRLLDAASEAAKGSSKIGSTLKGIGPTYMDKTGRNGLRFGDLFHNSFRAKYEELKRKHLRLLEIYPAIDFDIEDEETKWFESLEVMRQLRTVDTVYYLNTKLREGKKILAEGAQGSMLDIDFGTYPFVTSSNTITAGVCTGLGISPKDINQVIGISKAYCTRVGSGPFPTELENDTGTELRAKGHEYGATTGRPRRCGWLDLVQLRYASIISGVTQIILTKVDVLNGFSEICAAHSYSVEDRETMELPFQLTADVKPNYKTYSGWPQENLQNIPFELSEYIGDIEAYLDIPVTYISIGPARDQIKKMDPVWQP